MLFNRLSLSPSGFIQIAVGIQRLGFPDVSVAVTHKEDDALDVVRCAVEAVFLTDVDCRRSFLPPDMLRVDVPAEADCLHLPRNNLVKFVVAHPQKNASGISMVHVRFEGVPFSFRISNPARAMLMVSMICLLDGLTQRLPLRVL